MSALAIRAFIVLSSSTLRILKQRLEANNVFLVGRSGAKWSLPATLECTSPNKRYFCLIAAIDELFPSLSGHLAAASFNWAIRRGFRSISSTPIRCDLAAQLRYVRYPRCFGNAPSHVSSPGPRGNFLHRSRRRNLTISALRGGKNLDNNRYRNETDLYHSKCQE
ncbi:hypothetical protein GE09DRAFT_335835 [Coniochaeta sp. 2T2.1]|nr:hypothetical protein GE09DRAFT_335835 [Coniochaeta sp. 2T2.1]